MSREYGRVQSSVATSTAVCGALRKRVVVGRPFARGDALDLAADRDHRVDEPVELAEVLGFGRLDHQRARDRERHRRRVEAVVHEPLRDVVDASRPVSLVIGRRSMMHSCATRPFAPV